MTVPGLLVVIAVAAGVAVAAPAPTVVRQPIYYPTTIGTKWVYDYEVGGAVKGNPTYVVTDVAVKDGAKVVSVGSVAADGTVTPCDAVAISEQGLTRLTVPDLDLAPPLVILKLPHTAGREWPCNADYPGLAVKGTMTATGPEPVRVPAGAFDAIKVTADYRTNGGRDSRVTWWFVRDMGWVKQVRVFADGVETAEVLRTFTPGR
jgi:hypothetical protein